MEITEQDVKLAMAETYRQYIQGWAYIPEQCKATYEKAYNEIYGKK